MAHFASANLPCALAMCCFIIAQMSVPIGEYPRIYSCPFTSAFICPQLQCALASAHLPVPTPLPWPTPVPWPFAASHLVFGLLHGQVGGGKMVWHVGMGKWAGQVGMRTQNRAHGAAPAARKDNCAPGQDVSSAPAGAIYADMMFAEQYMRGCTLPSAHLPTRLE